MYEGHTSSRLLLTLTFVVVTWRGVQTQAPAGIRFSVSENAFDRFTTLIQHRIKHFMKNLTFENLTGHDNDLSWTLTNIHGSKLEIVEAHVKLGNDGNITVYAAVRDGSLTMNWSMSEVLLVGKAASTLQSKGVLEIDVGLMSIQCSFQSAMKGGSLSFSLDKCSTEISQLGAKSIDSDLNQFVELMASSFSPDLKQLLNDSVCKNFADLARKLQNMFTSFNLTQSLSLFGENATVDASFRSMKISKGMFQTLHKGDVILNGRRLTVTDAEFPHEPPSDGLAVDIKKEVLDNAVILLKDSKLLDVQLTFQRIIQNKLTWLNMTCWNTFCVENFLPDIASRWPERVVGVRMCVEDTRLTLANSSIVIYIDGRVHFSADNATDIEPMFSADCRLEVPFQLQFRNNTLSLKAAGVGGSFVIDRSLVGQILDPELQVYINGTVVEQQILPKINDIFEKHIISYPIPVAKDLALVSGKIILFDDMIRLQADLCDPLDSTFPAAPMEGWVGNTQVLRLQIDDVIPTTSAPTSTTKHPTSCGHVMIWSCKLWTLLLCVIVICIHK